MVEPAQPPNPPDAVHEVAYEVLQFKVTFPPWGISAVEGVNESIVTALPVDGAVTVTVVDFVSVVPEVSSQTR